MFWKRTTGHGAFWGLLCGALAAAITHGLSVAEGKGGWIGHLHDFYSTTGQAFSIASIAFIVCAVITIVISLLTRPKSEKELIGLVYSLTPKQKTSNLTWYTNPIYLGVIVLVIVAVFNVLFY